MIMIMVITPSLSLEKFYLVPLTGKFERKVKIDEGYTLRVLLSSFLFVL